MKRNEQRNKDRDASNDPGRALTPEVTLRRSGDGHRQGQRTAQIAGGLPARFRLLGHAGPHDAFQRRRLQRAPIS